MSISREDARELIGKLSPLTFKESRFLTSDPQFLLPAEPTFDAIREMCNPPMDVHEFDAIADELEREARGDDHPAG